MHRRFLKLRRTLAFTLLELSVSLAVVGILLGGAVVVIQQQAKKSVQEEATDDIDAIVEALVKFKIRKGHLPCPASLTELPSVATFGKEANAGDCTFTTAPAGTSRFETAASSGVFVVSGMVPVAELNLPTDKWSDKFGNRYSYTVMQTLTEPSTFEAGVASLVVKTGSADRQFTDGSFVVASLGKEGRGAYRFESGVLVSACGSTTLDSENCDGDITFIDTEIADSQTGATYYSDTVRWKSKQHFADIAITGGSPSGSPSGSASPTYGTPPEKYAFRLDGIDGVNRSGASVAIGDINGDGFGDAIVGAIWSVGYVYVVFGSATGIDAHPASLGTLNGTNGFRLDGGTLSDYVGHAVHAGDINNDGFDDIVIGAPFSDPSGFDSAGSVYVVFGKASGWTATLSLSTLNGTTGFRLNGWATNLQLGFSVSTGDLNNDGFGDLVMGSPEGNYGGSTAGRVFIVFGKASGWSASTSIAPLIDGTQGTSINANYAADRREGSSVSTGDVNGDGFDDVIVGAFWADPLGVNGAGETYVVFGRAGQWPIIGAFGGANGFIVRGVAADDWSGYAVGAGDINGDGFDDVIIGAHQADPGGVILAGATYVLFGKASGFESYISLSSLNGTNGFRVDGSKSHERIGTSISSADTNGDGFDDVVIGASMDSPNGPPFAGSTSVVFGKASGWTATVNLSTLNASSGFRLNGSTRDDLAGYSVATGDFNGDNYEDVLVGAMDASHNNIGRSGSVYGVYGRPSTDPLPKVINNLNVLCECIDPPTKKASRFDGAGPNDKSGSALAIGDVNGDGFGDAIIGVFEADIAGDTSGSTYVVFGSAKGIDAHPSNLNTLNGTNGFKLDGAAAGDTSAFSVAAGDVNGDGFDDVIIGAPWADHGAFNGGSIYVVFGKSSSSWIPPSISLSTLNGGNGFRLDGTNGTYAGGDVSSGDVNGDSFDDVIISDAISGSTYFVFGKASGWLGAASLSTLNGSNGLVWNGPVGYKPNATGDVNGDGFDDVMISTSGSTYVVFGKTSGWAASSNLSTLDGSNGFRLDGSNSTGTSISGDINNDGFDDISIGTNGDQSYVVFGKASGWAATTNLTTLNGSNGFRLDGVAGEFSGRVINSEGDVNGDGFDDIIIGAVGADNGGTESGSTYVVFGKASGWSATNSLATIANGTTGFRLDGSIAGDFVGYSIGVGDLTGDHIDDFLIQAFNASYSSTQSGSIYAVYGHPTRWKKPRYFLNQLCCYGTPPTDNAFRADSEAVESRTGYSVAIGDINGDGHGDAIIGAYYASPNLTGQAGKTYVVFGSASGIDWHPGSLSTLDGTNGFVLNGIDHSDHSGWSVSSGDVNNDGFDDVLIGAPSQGFLNNPGETYVVFGKASGWAASTNLSTLNGTTGFVLVGIDAEDWSGTSVSSGDVNGDGFDDVLIGASLADPAGQSEAGETYVVFGKASGWTASLNLSILNGTNGFVLNGQNATDYSGKRVSSGDINGDGFDDVIIGAWQVDPNGQSNAGATYVVFGKANGWAASNNLSALNGTTGFVLNGIDANDFSGSSVSSGDINGDGFGDVIIDAHYADPNGYGNAGKTYVVFGKSSGWAANTNLSTLNGTNGFILNGINDVNLGWDIGIASGDVNGDGFDDVVIGRSAADPNGQGNAGKTFVVFGKASGWDTSTDLSTLNGTNGFVLNGSTAYDYAGVSLAAGDMTGDNYEDILIGAFLAEYNGPGSGSVYGVYGKPISWSASYDLNTLAGIAPPGPDCPAPSGTPITGVSYSVSAVANSQFEGHLSETTMRDGTCGTYPSSVGTQSFGDFEWIMADLGAEYTINNIHLAPIPYSLGGWGAAYLNGYPLECSSDGSSWSNITTLSGHVDGTTTTYNVNSTCRYLRVTNGGIGFVGIGEFWFEGTPSGGGGGGGGENCNAGDGDGSLNQISPTSYSQSSMYGGFSGDNEAAMYDLVYESNESVIGTHGGAGTHWVMADLGSTQSVSRVNLGPINSSFGGWGAGYLNGSTLECSADGSSWCTLATLSGHADNTTTQYTVDASCRYVRVSVANNFIGIGEFWMQQ